MAFSTYDDMASAVPGFSMSNSGVSTLGGIKGGEQENLFGVAGQALTARGALEGQKALARAQRYMADKQADASKFAAITGIFGDIASAFTGGLGAAAGKKWFK